MLLERLISYLISNLALRAFLFSSILPWKWPGPAFIVAGGNLQPLAPNDSPEVSIIYKVIFLKRLYYPGFINISTINSHI